MLTFLKLWENMQSQESMPLNTSDSSLAMHTIKTGLNLRSENAKSFWSDFIQLCNNPDGMAELLNVRPDQVAGWAPRINMLVDRAVKDEYNSKTVLPTGNF